MKISIIIPVYNSEKTLSRCIESIVNQTYKNIEVIIVNDGSTDNSENIILNYIKKNNCIKYIKKNNGGVSSSRNMGLECCEGEYVQFVDADDYLERNMCEHMIESVLRNSCDLVICGYNCVSKNIVDCKLQNRVLDFEELQTIFSELYVGGFLNAPWNKLYKRSLIRDMFNKEISLGEDLIFNLNYLRRVKRISLIENCLYNYDITGSESLSSKYRENMWELCLMINKSIREFYQEFFGKINVNDEVCMNTILMRNLIGSIQLYIYNSKEYLNIKQATINNWIDDTIIVNASKNVMHKTIEYKIINYLIQKKYTYSIIMIFFLKKRLIQLFK
ncbi:MAG: glycosyltransferase family 2 protein [Clostridium sp.]|uniref:glycosyltransferase family 2 protein n=1 Tax=Clostridium sp. TaxID=1506 RepID=UPI0029138122|nr:glycosyltransferase family 2 protein [Clostridium sp.]MDU4937966.1 glycosyltransferase family 2 protein [Clostridium sp.]